MQKHRLSYPLIADERFLAFDVDGTLTPSRGVMDPEFKTWFLENVPMDRVILLTGSDQVKTVEQLGEDFYNQVPISLQCCGNSIWKLGKHRWDRDWSPSESLLLILNKELEASKYGERYGNHIETRVGMVNFSIVGRGAVGEQRERYASHDRATGERAAIAARIAKATGLEAVCGGETGIDIFPKGRDKSQLLNHAYRNISFFGDATHEGGNDFAVAEALRTDDRFSSSHEVYQVSGPSETRLHLEALLQRITDSFQ